MIIDELENTQQGYRDEHIKVNTLFFADDGLQFSENLEQAKLNIKNLMDISKKIWLGTK